ncbi:MAG: DnaJ domain-containing protein [Deltaproteobacteria bacterium]|nr:DnaJ domain-containing protein [Deltaproteobacteria bacterium]
MGIFKRLGDVARSNIEDLKDRIRGEKDADGGETSKPLGEMTDAELDAEIERRRRGRGGSKQPPSEQETLPGRPAPQPAKPRTGAEASLARAYANLELPEGASLERVKTAYRSLMERYHPDNHIDDPDAHAAALKLAQSLTKAYADLLAHLDPKKRG